MAQKKGEQTKGEKKQQKPQKETKQKVDKEKPKAPKKEKAASKAKPAVKEVKAEPPKPKKPQVEHSEQKPAVSDKKDLPKSVTTKQEKPKDSNQLRKRQNTKKNQPSRKSKGSRKESRKRVAKPVKSAASKAWETTRRELLYFFRHHWLFCCVSAAVIALLLALYFAVDKLDSQRTPPITDKVTFQFAINGTDAGAVELGLFGQTCPLTVRNFIMLATHEKGFGYIGSRIHMVIPIHIIVGGDITHGNGTGGMSALGQPFENENFRVHHSGPGYLGMLSLENNRDSSRSSIFYITINAMPRLDRNSVAFGIVTKGMEVIKKIEAVELDKDMIPLTNVTITDASHSPA